MLELVKEENNRISYPIVEWEGLQIGSPMIKPTHKIYLLFQVCHNDNCYGKYLIYCYRRVDIYKNKSIYNDNLDFKVYEDGRVEQTNID